MKTFMLSNAVIVAIATLIATVPVYSAEPPGFMQDTFPSQGIDAAWDSYQAVFLDPESALDPKTKELIALAVSAQIPCDYCVYYHTKAAKAHGAEEAELREALAANALIRKWSTLLNGSMYDRDQWHQEVDAMFSVD